MDQHDYEDALSRELAHAEQYDGANADEIRAELKRARAAAGAPETKVDKPKRAASTADARRAAAGGAAESRSE